MEQGFRSLNVRLSMIVTTRSSEYPKFYWNVGGVGFYVVLEGATYPLWVTPYLVHSGAALRAVYNTIDSLADNWMMPAWRRWTTNVTHLPIAMQQAWQRAQRDMAKLQREAGI